MPSEFTDDYHVHIIVRQGVMTFSDGKNSFTSRKDDLVIWQQTNTIQQVKYSDDFEADFLLASVPFLSAFNPEMVWASKGFIFIRINPSFHLDEEIAQGDECRLRTIPLSSDSARKPVGFAFVRRDSAIFERARAALAAPFVPP